MVELKIDGRVKECLEARGPQFEQLIDYQWFLDGNVIVCQRIGNHNLSEQVMVRDPKADELIAQERRTRDLNTSEYNEAVDELRRLESNIFSKMFRHKAIKDKRQALGYMATPEELDKRYQESVAKIEANACHTENRIAKRVKAIDALVMWDTDVMHHTVPFTNMPTKGKKGELLLPLESDRVVLVSNVLLAILNARSQDFDEIVKSANKNSGVGEIGLKMYLAPEQDFKVKYVHGTLEDLIS